MAMIPERSEASLYTQECCDGLYLAFSVQPRSRNRAPRNGEQPRPVLAQPSSSALEWQPRPPSPPPPSPRPRRRRRPRAAHRGRQIDKHMHSSTLFSRYLAPARSSNRGALRTISAMRLSRRTDAPRWPAPHAILRSRSSGRGSCDGLEMERSFWSLLLPD
jgi:hypothetical protein